VAHRYERIRIGFATETLRLRAPEAQQFSMDLARLIFHRPRFTIDPTVGSPCASPRYLYDVLGAVPTCPELSTELCAGESLNIGPYIVLHTKSRMLHRNLLSVIRKRAFDLLRRLAGHYRLVLIGEQQLADNPDWKSLGVYSLYEEFVAELPVLDLTVTRLEGVDDRMRQLRQDCLIMRDAVASIHLGMGGAACLSMAVGRSLSFRDATPHFYCDEAFGEREHDRVLCTRNWKRFQEALIRLLP